MKSYKVQVDQLFEEAEDRLVAMRTSLAETGDPLWTTAVRA